MFMGNTGGRRGIFMFTVFLGAVTGSLIGDIIGTSIPALSFMKSVYTIGTTSPLSLNLRVMSVILGFNFNLNLMSILGIIVAIILYRKF
jgi:hypothetical protein